MKSLVFVFILKLIIIFYLASRGFFPANVSGPCPLHNGLPLFVCFQLQLFYSPEKIRNNKKNQSARFLSFLFSEIWMKNMYFFTWPYRLILISSTEVDLQYPLFPSPMEKKGIENQTRLKNFNLAEIKFDL